MALAYLGLTFLWSNQAFAESSPNRNEPYNGFGKNPTGRLGAEIYAHARAKFRFVKITSRPFREGAEMKADTLAKRFASEVAASDDSGEYMRLLQWLEEFDGPCLEARVHILAERLGTALESHMGIERGILTAAFLAEYLERSRGK